MLSDEAGSIFFLPDGTILLLTLFYLHQMADKPYIPIACNLYDRLTDLATRRHKISLVVRTGTDGSPGMMSS